MNEQRPALRLPYPGLRPFEEADHGVFFGREEQLNDLLVRLEDAPLVAVIGSSGSGKSSLVRAGLFPLLKHGFLFGTKNWKITVARPGNQPYQRLATALGNSIVGLDANTVLKQLRHSDRGLIDIIRPLESADDKHTLVVIDQFEELFGFRHSRSGSTIAMNGSNVASRDEAAAFVAMLLKTVECADSRIHLILTMRSDFIGECDLFLGLPQAVSRCQFLVPRLTRSQMEEAIIRPGHVQGEEFEPFEFAPGLVTQLINDAGNHSDQLPLLQHTLMRMWKFAQASNRRVLTRDDYIEVGGIANSLSNDADTAWEALDNDKLQHIAQRMFLLLCDVSAEGQLLRRRPMLKEVMLVSGASRNEIQTVIRAFQSDDRNFILPPDKVSLQEDTILDISHESLLRQWHRLQLWIAEESNAATRYRSLLDDVKQGATVIHGVRLDNAVEWQKTVQPTEVWAMRYDNTGTDDLVDGSSTQVGLPECERLIEESLTARQMRQETKLRDQREREEAQSRELALVKELAASEKKKSSTIRGWLIAATCLAIAAGVLAIAAWRQGKNARSNLEKANQAKSKAEEMQMKAEAADKQTQLQLATLYNNRGRQALLEWDTRKALLYLTAAGLIHNTTENRLLLNMTVERLNTRQLQWIAQTGAVTDLNLSGSGKFLATSASDNGELRLWDTSNYTLAYTLSRQNLGVSALKFGKGDRRVLVGSVVGEAHLYELGDDTAPTSFDMKFHVDRITDIQLGPSDLVALASEDRRVSVWNVNEKKLIHTRSHDAPLVSALWLADNQLLSLSTDGMLICGQMQDSPKRVPLPSHPKAMYALDNQHVLVVTATGEFIILNKKGKIIRQKSVPIEEISITHTAWNNNNKVLAFSDQFGKVYCAKILFGISKSRSSKKISSSDKRDDQTTPNVDLIIQPALPLLFDKKSVQVTDLALDNGGHVYAVYDHGGAVMWDYRNEIVVTQTVANRPLASVTTLGDGNYTVGTEAGEVMLFRPPVDLETQSITLGKNIRLNDMVISPDHRYAVIGATRGKAYLVNLENLKVTQLVHTQNSQHWVNGILFSEDSLSLFTFDHESLAKWDIKTQSQQWKHRFELKNSKRSTSDVADIVWSKQDERIFVLHRDDKSSAWLEFDLGNRSIIREGKDWTYGVARSFVSTPTSPLAGILTDRKARFIRTKSGDDDYKHWNARAMAASPNGSIFAVTLNNGEILLTSSGNRNLRAWTGDTAPIEHVSFVGHDHLLSSSSSGEGKLWDLSGKLQARFDSNYKHKASISALSATPDQRFVFIGRENGMIEIFEFNSGLLILAMQAHKGPVQKIEPIDNDKFISIGWDGTFIKSSLQGIAPDSDKVRTTMLNHLRKFQDLNKEEQQVWDQIFNRLPPALKWSLLARANSNKGSSITSAGTIQDRYGKLDSLPNDSLGRALSYRLQGLKQIVRTKHREEPELVLSPDGTRIASFSRDGVVGIWQFTEGQLHILAQHSLGYAVWGASWSPDGHKIAVRGFNSEIQVYSAADESLNRSLNGHTGRIGDIFWDKDGKRLISGSRDHSARIWRVDKPNTDSIALSGHSDYVISVLIYISRAVTADKNGQLWLWDATNGKRVEKLEQEVQGWSQVNALALGPNGKYFFSGHTDGRVRKWDIFTGALIETQRPYDQPIKDFVVHKQNEIIAVPTSQGQNLQVFSTNNLSSPLRIFRHDGEPENRAQTSLDGRWLITKTSGERLVWDYNQVRIVARSNADVNEIFTGTVTQAGKYMITGDNEGNLLVWATREMHRPVCRIPQRFPGENTTVSPDLATVATWSADHVQWHSIDGRSCGQFGSKAKILDVLWSYDGIQCLVREAERVTVFQLIKGQWMFQYASALKAVANNSSDQQEVDDTNAEPDTTQTDIDQDKDDQKVPFDDEGQILGCTLNGKRIWYFQTSKNLLFAIEQDGNTAQAKVNLVGKDVHTLKVSRNGFIAMLSGRNLSCSMASNKPIWEKEEVTASDIVWSSDGNVILVTQQNGSFDCLNRVNGNYLWTGYGHSLQVVRAVAGEKWLVTIDISGTMCIYERATGRLVSITTQELPFTNVIIDHTEKQAVALDEMGGMYLVNLADSIAPPLLLRQGGDTIPLIRVDPSTGRLVGISRDGSVFYWNIESKNFTQIDK